MTARPLAAPLLALLLLVAAPRLVAGQRPPSSGWPGRTAPRVLPELRLDAVAGRHEELHLGVGGIVRLGNYARAALVVAGGAARLGGETRGAARGEGVVRFLLDPLRERRWGVYGAGGLAASWIDGEGWRTPLVVALGIEGPLRGGHAVALEVGLGGGTRVGIVLRGAREGRR